jgi:hypothetical protein
MLGNGLVILSGTVLEAPPPGGGLSTPILNAPVVTKKVLGIVTVMEVLLGTGSAVVHPDTPLGLPKGTGVQLFPFTVTMDVDTKPAPLTITESADPTLPTTTPEGEIEVTFGVVLADGVTANVCGKLVPPPGGTVTTVTKMVPGLWMSSAKTSAVNSLVLTKPVFSGFGVPPFIETSATETFVPAKPLPISVSVNAGEPAATVAGEMLLRTGFGLLITCWHDGSTSAVKTRIQRPIRDLSSKLLTPESVGSLCPLERNRRDY